VVTDRELWACALQVEHTHGERAPTFVAERVGELVLAGDAAGIERWQLIAAKLDQLANPRHFLPA